MFGNEKREIYTGEPTQLLWLERSFKMCGIYSEVKRVDMCYALLVSKEDEEQARALAKEYIEKYRKSMYDKMQVRELPRLLNDYDSMISMG